MSVRAFFAVDLSKAIRAALAGAMRSIPLTDAKAKPVAQENLHVTLHFLGDVPDDRVMAAQEAGQAAASAVRAFEVGVEGLVSVPPQGKLRMIWASVADPSGRLGELHGLLGQQLGQREFDVDPRPLKPHVTLCRLRHAPQPEPIREAVGAASQDFGRTGVSQLVLYSSELTKAGPIYMPMARMDLGQ